MIARDPLVTEDELHAYVDGELPPGRRSAVEAWLATHPEAAAAVGTWRSQAELIQVRYGGVADEPMPDRFSIDSIARLACRRRNGWIAAAAAAALVAFIGGGAAGWFAHGAAAAGPSDLKRYTAEAFDAYRLYVVEVRHPVEVPGDERPHLTQWLSKRVGSPVRIPELEKMGLKLVGGRLLPGPTGPTAFFMYETPSGERFTLYCGQTKDQPTALRYIAGKNNSAYYWVDGDLFYVLTGPAEQDRLHAIAQAAYDQIDMRTSPQGG